MIKFSNSVKNTDVLNKLIPESKTAASFNKFYEIAFVFFYIITYTSDKKLQVKS